MIREDLATLLDARTVRVHGSATHLGVRVRSPTRRTRKSGADVALVATQKDLEAVDARVVLAPSRSTKELSPLAARALVLGRGSALWSPGLAVGLAEPAVVSSANADACLVITQGRQVAHQVMLAAARHSLPLRGVICTGRDQPTSWSDLLQAAWQLDPPVVPLIALHLATPPAQLATTFEAAARCGGVALLLAAAAAATTPSDVPGDDLALADLATAGGWPKVATTEQLVVAALLHRAGLRRKTARVRCRGAEPDERALIEEVVPHEMLARSSRARVDCDLRLGSDARLEARIAATETTVAPSSPLEVTASAVAATLHPLAEGKSATRRSRKPSAEDAARSTLARMLLDHWENGLDQPKCSQLLGCFDISAVAAELVRSPSAAAEAAGRVGLPVTLSAVGPSLLEDGIAALDIPTASAARRAFRDLLDRCASMDPTPVVDGVLVRPWRTWARILQATVLFAQEAPPLVRLSTTGEPGLALPASILLDRAEAIASALIGRRPLAATKRFAKLLRRIATLAALLADRLSWLRLTIGIPEGQPPSNASSPLVCRCNGWQRLRLYGLMRPTVS